MSDQYELLMKEAGEMIVALQDTSDLDSAEEALHALETQMLRGERERATLRDVVRNFPPPPPPLPLFSVEAERIVDAKAEALKATRPIPQS